jgi:CRISPR-associated protein Cas1
LTLSLFNIKILQQDDFRLEYPAPPIEQTTPGMEPTIDITADPYGHMSDLDCRTHFDIPSQRMGEDVAQDLDSEYGGGKPAVKLNDDAFRRVVENFERKMTTEFYYPPEERTISYGDALIAQAGMYRKVIEGSLRVYQPLLLK